MALLGTFVDRTTLISFTGPTTGATFQHSLAATPDSIWIEPRSITQGGVGVWFAQANGSITTVGTGASFIGNSVCDIYVRVFHSLVKVVPLTLGIGAVLHRFVA